MVPSLARMSVIIKSQHETSVMTGNYEMAYICGLLCRLTGTVPPSLETPVQLQEDMMKLLENYSPEDDREKVVIKMLKFYKPDGLLDDQVRELYRMGLEEKTPWTR